MRLSGCLNFNIQYILYCQGGSVAVVVMLCTLYSFLQKIAVLEMCTIVPPF